jgi:YVTN family beta-propeller protein
VSGPAGRGEGLRRSHDEAAGVKPGTSPVNRTAVNVGTLRSPFLALGGDRCVAGRRVRMGAEPSQYSEVGRAGHMGKGGSERKQGGTVMSEDAPVNTGATGWPSIAWAFLAVRRMQTKLHCWAVTDRDRRFDDLYNLVCDPAFLTIAWERVASNTGARTPGVDRATVAHITSGMGVEAFLQQVRDELKSRSFQPVPVRQVMIPKASGKLHKLGIPTVTDRVVQAALKLVLEPIFEADFQSCSYGFRPNRRAHDAIAEIHHFATQRYHWVLEADIEACFDMIDHTALMDRLRVRVSDKRVLALVKAFLKAGVAMDPSGGRAYVVSHNTNSMSVIDTATNNIQRTIRNVGSSCVAVAPSGPTVYVTNESRDVAARQPLKRHIHCFRAASQTLRA